jgi:hypothetical protein
VCASGIIYYHYMSIYTTKDYNKVNKVNNVNKVNSHYNKVNIQPASRNKEASSCKGLCVGKCASMRRETHNFLSDSSDASDNDLPAPDYHTIPLATLTVVPVRFAVPGAPATARLRDTVARSFRPPVPATVAVDLRVDIAIACCIALQHHARFKHAHTALLTMPNGRDVHVFAVERDGWLPSTGGGSVHNVSRKYVNLTIQEAFTYSMSRLLLMDYTKEDKGHAATLHEHATTYAAGGTVCMAFDCELSVETEHVLHSEALHVFTAYDPRGIHASLVCGKSAPCGGCEREEYSVLADEMRHAGVTLREVTVGQAETGEALAWRLDTPAPSKQEQVFMLSYEPLILEIALASVLGLPYLPNDPCFKVLECCRAGKFSIYVHTGHVLDAWEMDGNPLAKTVLDEAYLLTIEDYRDLLHALPNVRPTGKHVNYLHHI